LADSQFVAIPSYGTTYKNVFCADLDKNGFNDIVTVRFDPSDCTVNLDIRFNDGQGHFLPNPILGLQDHFNFGLTDFKNWPNPFQDVTVFNFSLKETSIAELSVFDLNGKFITCLINQKMEGGTHLIKWRGLDNGNQPCKPGAFIAYLKVNGKICQSIKIIKA